MASILELTLDQCKKKYDKLNGYVLDEEEMIKPSGKDAPILNYFNEFYGCLQKGDFFVRESVNYKETVIDTRVLKPDFSPLMLKHDNGLDYVVPLDTTRYYDLVYRPEYIHNRRYKTYNNIYTDEFNNIKPTSDLDKDCKICAKPFILDVKDKDTTIFKDRPYPLGDMMILRWKDYYFVPNYDNSMPKHLMLIKDSHVCQKIFLEKETLSDFVHLINLFRSENMDFCRYMHFNFMQGSINNHFHIHITQVRAPVCKVIDEIIRLNPDCVTYSGSDVIKKKYNNNNIYREITVNNKDNLTNIYFEESKFNYFAHVILVKKDNVKKLDILYKSLRRITKYLHMARYLYTFAVTTYYNEEFEGFILYPLANTTKNVSSPKISGLLREKHEKSYLSYTIEAETNNRQRKELLTGLNRFRVLNYGFNDKIDEDSNATFKYVENNIFSDLTILDKEFFDCIPFNYFDNLTSDNYLNFYVEGLSNKYILKPKSTYDKDMIILMGPYGIGKTTETNNFIYSLGKNPEDFLEVNIDKIVTMHPNYIRNIKKLNKKIKEKINWDLDLTTVLKDLKEPMKLSDLKNDDSMLKLKPIQYMLLYKHLFENTNSDYLIDGKTFINYSTEIYVKYHSLFGRDFRKKLISNNFYGYNIIFESVQYPYYEISRALYSYQNKYYINFISTDKDDVNVIKLLLRNILFRNIYEARMLSYNTAVSGMNISYAEFNNYKYNINSFSDFINIPKDLTDKKIKDDRFLFNGENIIQELINKKINYKYTELKESDLPKSEECILDFDNTDKLNKDSDILCFLNFMEKQFKEGEEKDKYATYKNKLTSAINNHILGNSFVRGKIIFMVYTYLKDLINEYITLKGILTENDIVIILKGNSNYRLVLRKYINILFNKVNKRDHKKLYKMLKFLHNDKYENEEDNIFKKSDLDFNIYINPTKFATKEKYDEVSNDISIIVTIVLYKIKSELETNNTLNISLKSTTSHNYKFLNEMLKEYLLKGNPEFVDDSDYKLNSVKLGNNEFFTKRNPSHKPKTINKSNYIVVSKDMITKNDVDYVFMNLIRENKLLNYSGTTSRFDVLFNHQKYFGNDEENGEYFISINKNLKLRKGFIDRSFELHRLKLSAVLNFVNSTGESKEISSNSEILDISTMGYYNQLQKHFFEDLDTNREILNYKSPLYNFDITVQSLEYILDDLEVVFFQDNFNIWNDKKYEKRLKRYFYITFVLVLKHLMTKKANIYTIINKYITEFGEIIEKLLKKESLTLVTITKNNLFISLINFIISRNIYLEKFNNKSNKTEFDLAIKKYNEEAVDFNINIVVNDEYIAKFNMEFTKYLELLQKFLEELKENIELTKNIFIKHPEITFDINNNFIQWGGN